MFLVKSHIDNIMNSMEKNLNNSDSFDSKLYQNRKSTALQYLNLSSQILDDLDLSKDATFLTQLMFKVAELEIHDKNDIFFKRSEEENIDDNPLNQDIQVEEELEENPLEWLVE